MSTEGRSEGARGALAEGGPRAQGVSWPGQASARRQGAAVRSCILVMVMVTTALDSGFRIQLDEGARARSRFEPNPSEARGRRLLGWRRRVKIAVESRLQMAVRTPG